MQRSDFHFDLPDELIARYPTETRSGSRLLRLNRRNGALADDQFCHLPDLLAPGDLLIFNDTRVMAARLYGRKQSGGKVELLVERIVTPQRCLAHMKVSKAPAPGQIIVLDGGTAVTVGEREGTLVSLTLASGDWLTVMQAVGHMPLPPYMKRDDDASDESRYQTVYARQPGAVAAPTAGLHFDEPLFARLAEKGVESAFVTLHVGAGTFQPVRVDNILEHEMHREWLQLSAATVAKIEATRARGGRVIAVGTTSVRCLESVAQQHDGKLVAWSGETQIFIYPGYDFQVIDGLITNFHLPESTLIMLVSALAGREPIMRAYAHAIAERYRFYSYGDAMLILEDPS